MSRQPSTIRRIWLTIAPCEAPGRVGLKLSLMPPADMTDCMAVLLTRGDLPPGWPVELEVVSDPSADPSLRGPQGEPGKDGLSAYQIARQLGYGGTTAQWLASLIGAPGKDASPAKDGLDGLSAYQLARQAGYGGTLTQWLASLVGAAGASAYDLARAAGYGGTQAQWIASLKGDKGDAGTSATTLLGTLTLSETILAAVTIAGMRRLTVTTPAAWGVSPGQDLVISAASLPSSAYALHDVVVTDANTISVGITTPALVVASKYSIPCRLRRLN